MRKHLQKIRMPVRLRPVSLALALIFLLNLLSSNNAYSQATTATDDGTYTYFTSHYDIAIPDGIGDGSVFSMQFDYFWITDMDGVPLSGLGEYSISVNDSQVVTSGYESNEQIMYDSQLSADVDLLSDLLALFGEIPEE